jgi:preprotein translocase SecE subunit
MEAERNAMNKTFDPEFAAGDERQADMRPTAAVPLPASARPSAFHVYKPGQGLYVRWGSAAGAGILVLGFAAFLQNQLTLVQNEWVEYLVPAVVLVALAYFTFRVLGQSHPVVDFMVATEGEMKKVNWSTWREVIGATKVVIVTVFALGTILCIVDIFFMAVFEAIGVLRIGMLSQLFRGAGPIE